jgi:UDP-N-acetylglucosamine--N-acetylmuramyl-(pentapeptide) pyrophosphoryl-undecaprenol N-acetylglucosamine transferase
VRQAFCATGPRTGDPRPTLLVFGGSQGAHFINEIVISSLAALQASIPRLHIIHQTGERDYNQAQAAYLAAGGSAEVYPFIDDMPSTFARADLLLCRSGASTVAEVMVAAKPAIFVPFPRAADDHQKRNAEALERAGAAVMAEEKSLTKDSLVELVSALLDDPEKRASMAQAAHKFAHPHAASEIAGIAARLAGVRTATD